MVTVTFEVHATTYDNEDRISSGFYDAELSQMGLQQCQELGKRHTNEDFAAIFCSDLQRSYKTAELAFGDRFPIIKDARLRECDYGDLTRHPASEVESERARRITDPFPGGESYKQAFDRIGALLTEIERDYDGKSIMIIGHGATWRAMEYWLGAVPLDEAVTVAHVWQPGWEYQLHDLTV